MVVLVVVPVVVPAVVPVVGARVGAQEAAQVVAQVVAQAAHPAMVPAVAAPPTAPAGVAAPQLEAALQVVVGASPQAPRAPPGRKALLRGLKEVHRWGVNGVHRPRVKGVRPVLERLRVVVVVEVVLEERVGGQVGRQVERCCRWSWGRGRWLFLCFCGLVCICERDGGSGGWVGEMAFM